MIVVRAQMLFIPSSAISKEPCAAFNRVDVACATALCISLLYQHASNGALRVPWDCLLEPILKTSVSFLVTWCTPSVYDCSQKRNLCMTYLAILLCSFSPRWNSNNVIFEHKATVMWDGEICWRSRRNRYQHPELWSGTGPNQNSQDSLCWA